VRGATTVEHCTQQVGDEFFLSQYFRSEVVMMVNMKITVYWNAMSYSLVDVHHCLRGIY
jgi:hypothetical protein